MNNSSISNTELPQLATIWQETTDWCPTELQQVRLQSLYTAVITANQQLNLTRITEPAEFWEKHLWDSIRGIGELIKIPSALKVIDIGTGAGFPGLPLAIARTDWQLTLVDSTAKKVGFISSTAPELGLTNVHPVVSRIEDVGQDRQHRHRYDLALIRAVASVNVCAEYALPLVKIGGTAILYRGNWTQEEADLLELAVAKLGGEISKIDRFNTPLSDSIRHCIYLHKIADTHPYYPRAVGIPTQKPL
ncbi:16S rRNA (guanine(527)-N(7))-methyltransferase RsmG [Chamaesiphon polymorphus]|uniref:Ribosomal RNA small subunit methyltransferase G n=1 Tax=Chamaesiphon polymorphus CCALA 037 TaxID=2107692 RepID=A0A2T1GNG0_9CYAN|nr:16S rRNA (guanine(527)-N(7))-methyltransferase RsmG [Chamaesiphon polymorphus]PSB59455.1 16S rRNA (guanine(527)-N(7))-methyltransferase RsmG [Chamaesiphon polymorphus CCALA 037]